MIKVIINNDDVEIVGHANYAPHGQDIVCASVSAVFYFLCRIVGMENVKRLNKGDIHIIIEDDVLKKAFRSFISDLEEQYPNHIKLEGE